MAGDEQFPIDPDDPRDAGGGGARGGARRRVPPHNLQAEESVLGALLLSREAIGVVGEAGLTASDFYNPANQHVFDAIRSIYSTSGPVDVVTVSDELRRHGLLDEIGGIERLNELQNATPSVSGAEHYAQIVMDTALLRRLIQTAGEITELAFNEPDDARKAVDEAESRIFQIADEKVSDTTRPINELLNLTMDQLEENFERGDTITGTATGYDDLDELLSGLQGSTLNIVGARPAMGKCVAWDTPMVDLETGDVVTAAELMERATARGSLHLPSLDDSGRIEPRAVSACLDDGVKPTFRLTTRSGRDVRVTAAHPFLTQTGWRRLADIEVGDEVAVPAVAPTFGSEQLPDAEIDEIARCCGVDGGRDDATVVPDVVFRLDRSGASRFLNRLFATDGSAWVAEAGYARIGYGSVSRHLAVGVAHLLRRFGLRVTVRERAVANERGRARVIEVEIMDSASLLTFADEIGILGMDDAVGRVRSRAERAVLDDASPDLVPSQVWIDILKAKEAAGLSWADIDRRTGRGSRHDWHASRRGHVRRSTVAELAELFDDEQLRRWASPDVLWERVTAIEPAGDDRVIDFTVPDTHNFVAADFVLHNTAFGLGLATHIAKNDGRPVLVFSLEMGHAELTQRILASEAKVDSTKLRTGRLTEADWSKIGLAVGRLECPLFLDDNPQVTVMEIRAKARRLKAQHGGLACIVIDYLQLMSGSGKPENRQLEVSEISRNLKVLARELECPIVALSQLSRNLEARSDKRPMLADLRESGSLEQDADVVMFLYRDEVYNEESPDKGSAEVIVAKHRAGPIGTKRLVFLGQYTRFDNAARSI